MARELAKSTVEAAERIARIDRQAIEQLRAEGLPFTVPEFLKRWLELEACKPQ